MDEFNKFINSRNEIFQKEFCEKFKKEVQEIIASDNSANILESIGRYLGMMSTTAYVDSNELTLEHIKAYHQWLQKNYELTPKK